MTLCWELAWPSTGKCLKTPKATIASSQPELEGSDSSARMGAVFKVWIWSGRKTARRKEEMAENAVPQQEEAGRILSQGTQRILDS